MRKNIIILCSVLILVLACGVVFQLVDTEEPQCSHLFRETVYFADSDPNEHVVRSVCRTCGVTLSEETAAHVIKIMTDVPPEEMKNCPAEAVSLTVEGCVVCKYLTRVTATLADLSFDGDLRIPLDEYVGSTNYQAMIATEPIESYKRTIAYFDQDPAFTCWNSALISTQANIADGKLVMTAKPFNVKDDLNLVSANSKYAFATISFDLTVNKDPATYTGDNGCWIFSTHDENLYNNCPIVLALGNEDLNPADDVAAYELIVYSKQNGKTVVEGRTGVTVELGKEYTYQIEIDRDAAQFTLSYKLVEAENFQRVGTYTYVPSKNISVVRFAGSLMGTGNTFDNYRVTVELF